MFKYAIVALVSLCLTTAAHAMDPDKEASIRELLTLTKSAELGVQSMELNMPAMQRAMPQLPAEFWTRFRAKVNKQEIEDMIVPVYDRHFTHEEIKGLIAFYSTELGSKTLEVMPIVMRESTQAGQAWGAKIGQEVMMEIQLDKATQETNGDR